MEELLIKVIAQAAIALAELLFALLVQRLLQRWRPHPATFP